MVRSMLLPSIFAVLLPVCLISVLPEPGHATLCKDARESELKNSVVKDKADCDENGKKQSWKCANVFCSTPNGLVFFNSWTCYAPSATLEQCALEGGGFANDDRAKMKLPSRITDWKCQCFFGEIDKDMDSEKHLPPAKMTCKYQMESEDATFNEQLKDKLNKMFKNNEKIQCIKEKGKCGAVFCKANNGELKLKWRKWACFSADYAKKACAKNEANAVNDERAKWSDSKLPKADGWKCRCLFGDNGTDMTNDKFVPKNATAMAIRHGDGMPMMLVGIIMAILPPFHYAILDQLQMN
ncbi:hypothetical protein niasHT_032655 [Heterodera trifolii]|uniref:Uncharacterized protein n=1 Tax=Heterodera trifolii TaxID=157864 RepID=A0ABD2IR14_9BILA